MKKILLSITLLAVLGTASIANAATYSVPWFTGTTVGSSVGNPFADTAGNKWSVYEQWSMETNYTDINTFQPMNWTGTNWTGPNATGGQPTYELMYLNDEYFKTLSSAGYQGNTSWVKRQSALFFEPATQGAYSWNGTILATGNGDADPDAIIAFGKFSTSGTWTELHRADYDNGTTVNIGAISNLQNISVGSGDRLALVLASRSYWGYNYLNIENASITAVPEPGSLVALCSGLAGLFGVGIRRRQLR